MLPPSPRAQLKGRRAELKVLEALLTSRGAGGAVTRLALVGPGGSGKSMLAAVLAHRVAKAFPGGAEWFRVGSWDARTLLEMLALRFGVARQKVPSFLAKTPRLLVLDNHEDDAAMARFLDLLARTKASFVITARRCLLSGVLVYPVTAPLVTSGRSAFPAVSALTRRLRWNPLALDIASAIVTTRTASLARLTQFLDQHGIAGIHVVEHEDDLPEVALLVAYLWERLGEDSRRILGVLSHLEGDHFDVAALTVLARAEPRALDPLVRWHLVQEHAPGRFTAHAVVKHAVRKRTVAAPKEAFDYFVSMLEAHPEKLAEEQTHLFAAMDVAHRSSDLDGMLRVERLLASLEAS